MRSRKPPKPKTPSITEEIRAKDKEQRLRDKAYEIWEKRGKAGTSEENWQAAIKALQRQRFLQPFSNFWHWTGIQEKKGWDILQLLIAPIVLAAIGLGLQEYVKQHDQKLADEKAKQETLVKYLDQMADSLKDGLRSAKPGSDKFIIAQSRTVIALQSLDRNRQHLVVQFLQASGLSEVSAEPKLDKNGDIRLRNDDRVLLYQALMESANLANSDLSGVVLIGVNLSNANLGCIPPESKKPSQCSDLSNAVLSGADFRLANLSAANLADADLSNAKLSGAALSNANLSRANLLNADLRNVDLRNANLVNANLRNANFFQSDLSHTDLSNTDLSYAKLGRANLSGAKLRNTNLSIDFLRSSANFSSAILLATDLRHTKALTQEQLEGEKPPLLCHMALPEGFPDKDKLKDRDCDKMPAALHKRYPQDFKSLEEAKQYVDEQKQKKWE